MSSFLGPTTEGEDKSIYEEPPSPPDIPGSGEEDTDGGDYEPPVSIKGLDKYAMEQLTH